MPITYSPRHNKVHQKVHQKGLALIEVLLSLGLSSVMFLVLFTAQSHSQKVLLYSQQLHDANRLLDQVAIQVWAYPNHYKSLATAASQSGMSCLNGRYCNPVDMTQAWATYWQSYLHSNCLTESLAFYVIAAAGLVILWLFGYGGLKIWLGNRTSASRGWHAYT